MILFLLFQIATASPTPKAALVGASRAPVPVTRDLSAAARAIRINKAALDGFNRLPMRESAPSPITPVANAPSAPSPFGPSQEAQWRARVRMANEAVQRAEADLQRADERFAAASTCPRSTGETVARLREALERAKARLAEARERQAALPEEARRAGVPPGWIR